MEEIVDILSWACLMAGGAFSIIGAIGILRLPDVFARMHGAGIIDTMGAGLIVLGLILQAGFTLISVKLFLIIAFLFFTRPLLRRRSHRGPRRRKFLLCLLCPHR